MDVHWTSTQATKEIQFRFFLELTKNTKSPSCPQAKQFDSETSVLMCSRVILHHHAWSLVSDDLFWSLKAVLLRKQKDFTFLSHWNFSCLSHLQRNLSTEAKKKWGVNSLLLWKTNLKTTVERRQNHLRQSQLIFQKTFRTLPQKWRNFQVCLFFLLWVEAQNEIGRNSFRNDWC